MREEEEGVLPKSPMGISGLLQTLTSVSEVVDIVEYRGLTVGVDVSGWLHRRAPEYRRTLTRPPRV